MEWFSLLNPGNVWMKLFLLCILARIKWCLNSLTLSMLESFYLSRSFCDRFSMVRYKTALVFIAHEEQPSTICSNFVKSFKLRLILSTPRHCSQWFLSWRQYWSLLKTFVGTKLVVETLFCPFLTSSSQYREREKMRDQILTQNSRVKPGSPCLRKLSKKRPIWWCLCWAQNICHLTWNHFSSVQKPCVQCQCVVMTGKTNREFSPLFFNTKS